MGGCHENGAAVMDCRHSKRWVRHKNPRQASHHGEFKYQAQCEVCGATGAFQAEPPTTNYFIEPDEAKAFKAFKEDQRLQDLKKDQSKRRALIKQMQGEWKDNYNKYLQSEEWKAMREKILERDNYLCQGCMDEKATEIHHFTYENAGDELMWELVSTCARCHAKAHGKPYVDIMELLERKGNLKHDENELPF